jgi:predicted deacylase
VTESKAKAKTKATAKTKTSAGTKVKVKTKAKTKSKTKVTPRKIFCVGGTVVPRGTRQRLDLPAGRLPTGDLLSLPVIAFNGSKPGPTLWLNAAIHGDEINGMEIIHEVLERLDPKRLSGRILAVPIVNVYGFIQQTRYLPDRRDLNRHFPGSKRGSLASRLAYLFMEEIVKPCDYGIDLHTGSLHRANLPQIRAKLEDPETRRMAEAFGAPMMYRARTIRGSLRAAASKLKMPVLTYEAGEPLRFDEDAIDSGVRGVLRVLSALGMRKLQAGERKKPKSAFEAVSTHWTRAPRGGVLHLTVRLGQEVKKGAVLGTISDPASEDKDTVKSRHTGIVIGYTNNPLIYQGDAMVHVAVAKTTQPAS